MPSRTNAAAIIIVSVRLPFFACSRDGPSKNHLALQVLMVSGMHTDGFPSVDDNQLTNYIHVLVEILIPEIENWTDLLK